jgi:two-component system sensor histidine kinase RegB
MWQLIQPASPNHPLDSDAQRLAANAAWLVLLRWVAVVGQLLTISVAHYVLRISLPLGALVAVVGCTAASNLLFAAWTRRLSAAVSTPAETVAGTRVLAAVMAMDIIALTALLYFSGGTVNPFSVFYLVNLALGAVLLSERWGWLLTVVATLGMLGLWLARADRPELFAVTGWLPGSWLGSTTADQFGRIVATAGCALVIIHFVSRVTHQLQQTAAELRRVERERSRSEKLEALGTLAGGAAHELATPLSTIAVVASEMTRMLQDVNVPESVREDAALIRAEVNHCQKILQRMTGQAGQWTAEQHVDVSLRDLLAATLDELAQPDRVELVVPEPLGGVTLSVPRESLAQALRGLLQNALDATRPGEAVRIAVEGDEDWIRLVVQDEGPGMSPEVLLRAGEPFFTTKDPGRGMGLGLFLTRSVIERLGGRLELSSAPQRGVTAVVTLPRQV